MDKQPKIYVKTFGQDKIPVAAIKDGLRDIFNRTDKIFMETYNPRESDYHSLIETFNPENRFLDYGFIVPSNEFINYRMFDYLQFSTCESNEDKKKFIKLTWYLDTNYEGSTVEVYTAFIIGGALIIPKENPNFEDEEYRRGYIFTVAANVATFYMMANYQALHYADNLEELPEKEYHYSEKKKRKGKKPVTKHVIHKSRQFRISKVVDDDYIHAPRKPIQRKTDSWGVCGHYRHYKSGKVVFVRPHIKGKRDEVKPHTYVVNATQETNHAPA